MLLRWTLCLALVGMIANDAQSAESVTLISDGVTTCCVVVGKEAAFRELALANWDPKSPLLKWAAEDLADYLAKMSGAKVPVVERPAKGLMPIYVGSAPEGVRLKNSTEFGDAYLVDVARDRIVLHGESRRAVYYAAAHLLTELGVRWYAPGDLGEVVPVRKSVTVAAGRVELSPHFVTRNFWMFEPDEIRWSYRNRMGSPAPQIPGGHTVSNLLVGLPGVIDHPPDSKELEKGRKEHPEFYNVTDDRRHWSPNFAHPEVVRVFASNVIAHVRKGTPDGLPRAGKFSGKLLSASPDSALLVDERPELIAINGTAIDLVLRKRSFSEAWFAFLNRVCAEIDQQAPGLDFRLTTMAEGNYALPPKKVKLDPRIIPVIGPSTFNRFTSMGTPGAPTSELFEQAVQAWATTSPRVGLYLVNYNRGDAVMPYTRRVPWTKDFPRYFALGIKDVSIESATNWHTMMPGNYVAARLLWDTRTNVDTLLDEYYPTYYGNAATAMRQYDTTLENAYESTKVFTASTWGMHRILTPKVMAELDQSLVEAEQQVAGNGVFTQRVEIRRISHNVAVQWFASRDALNSFRLEEAAVRSEQVLAHLKSGSTKYPLFFPPNNNNWSVNPERYFERFHHSSYKDAGRIAREGTVIHTLPDELLAKLEVIEGDAKPSDRMPDVDQGEWRPLKTFSASLDEQGLTFFRGVISLQHKFEIPKTARDAKVLKLWFGGVDTRVRVWLNGTDLGEKLITVGPHEVDVSAAIAREGPNTLLVTVDNTIPNQLGVGGIIRPVLIYTPK